MTTWLSRGPGRVPPYTSLIRTMDAGCWASTLASVVSVSLALLLTVKVGRSYYCLLSSIVYCQGGPQLLLSIV